MLGSIANSSAVNDIPNGGNKFLCGEDEEEEGEKATFVIDIFSGALPWGVREPGSTISRVTIFFPRRHRSQSTMAKRRTAIRARAPNSLAPVRILKQIAILQITYYLAATLLILFTMLVAGHSFSAQMVLGSSTAVRGDTALGLTMGLLWLVSGLVV